MLSRQKICRVSKNFENYGESAKIMVIRQMCGVSKKNAESAKVLKFMLSWQKICRVSKKLENYAESAKIMVSRQKIC